MEQWIHNYKLRKRVGHFLVLYLRARAEVMSGALNIIFMVTGP